MRGGRFAAQCRCCALAMSSTIGDAAGRGVASRAGARRKSASVCRNSENQFCTDDALSLPTMACQRSRRSSTLMPRASAICRAMPSMSCGLTNSAASSCLAAPAKAERTRTPGSNGFCAATYSLATRFMPSCSGVTKPTCATR